MTILLFLALTLAGTYYVRKRILEKHMAAAIEMNDEQMIRLLLNSWPCPVNVRARSGDETHHHPWDETGTPLLWAVEQGDFELVKLCVSRGADVNAADDTGRSPLHIAISDLGDWRHKDQVTVSIVRLLVANGANVNARDRPGFTPLAAAKDLLGKAESDEWMRANEEIISILLQHGAKE